MSKGGRVFIFAFTFWLIALFIFGLPVWLVLIHLNKTRFTYALLSGFLIPFIVTLAMLTHFFTGRSGGNLSAGINDEQTWSGGVMTAYGWQESFWVSAQFAALGALIAAVIWFVAYGRRKTSLKVLYEH